MLCVSARALTFSSLTRTPVIWPETVKERREEEREGGIERGEGRKRRRRQGGEWGRVQEGRRMKKSRRKGGRGGVGASSHTQRSFTGHQSITERFKVVLVE